MRFNRIQFLILMLVSLLLCGVPPTSLDVVRAEGEAANFKLLLQSILDQVDSHDLEKLVGDLSGENEILIYNGPYRITTRHALSGTPIAKAAQFLFRFYEDIGLQVSYSPFSYQGKILTNIAAQKVGSVFPERIFLITSHYDDLPAEGLAPGADDNASGTAAIMLAAAILSQYDFGCTLRFVNFGAEEYGKIGSKDYAHQAYCAGEDIQGVINLDMIAWNSPGSSPGMDLHPQISNPASMGLAVTFQEVILDYNLDLIPELPDAVTTRSDHASFWIYGFPAILVTEDWQDFNPNYHSEADNLENLKDMQYFTNMVKASLGTLSLAGCLVDDGWGTVTGQVVDFQNQEPVPNISIWLYNPEWDHIQFTRSDSSGNYQFSALTGWNKLGVDGMGYARQDQDVLIMQNQVLEMKTRLKSVQEQEFYLPISTNKRNAPLPGCP